jgi:WhiB family transcriptional regulator, redox-sensing transcriptional regulator
MFLETPTFHPPSHPTSSSKTTERGDAMMTLAPTPSIPVIGLEDVPCRRFDPDLWFADAPAELELAKSLCTDCPVRVECLAGAVERAEPWGVWGGEIFERGEVIARKRPRGRPRKADLARDLLVGSAV